MAFKMAEGSAFAVLLRSPWYYSALIGAALALLSLILPSAQIAILVAAASLPFFGIALFAAYKQFQRPSPKQIGEIEQQARSMTAKQVSQKIAEVYIEARFDSVEFKGNAAQLELERGNRKLLVNSKRFKAANSGIEPLKEMVNAGEKIEATGYIYVALGTVSAAAREFAAENNIELVYGARLVEYFSGKAAIN